METKAFYTPKEAADLLEMNFQTIRKNIREGKIKATLTPGGRKYLIAHGEIERVFGPIRRDEEGFVIPNIPAPRTHETLADAQAEAGRLNQNLGMVAMAEGILHITNDENMPHLSKINAIRSFCTGIVKSSRGSGGGGTRNKRGEIISEDEVEAQIAQTHAQDMEYEARRRIKKQTGSSAIDDALKASQLRNLPSEGGLMNGAAPFMFAKDEKPVSH